MWQLIVNKLSFLSNAQVSARLWQRRAMVMMGFCIFLTFLLANLHALLWTGSQWLVSTVLPAVVVDLTNEARSGEQVSPLLRNPLLDKAARLKAEHMAVNEYFSHYSPDGVSPWYWFELVGYEFAHAGENLGIHFTDSGELVDAWMRSPLHRDNILAGRYREIGVGTAVGTYEGYQTVYVVQMFGSPMAVPVDKVAVEAEGEVEAPFVVEESQFTVTETNIDTEDTDLTEDIDFFTEVLAESVDLSTTATPTEENVPVATLEHADSEQVNVLFSSHMSTSSVTNEDFKAFFVGSSYDKHTPWLLRIATQPSTWLQAVYLTLATMVVLSLLVSIILGVRQGLWRSVSFSFLLLVVMVGLWSVHVLLTAGSVIA